MSVTAFVATIGSPSLDRCLRAVTPQCPVEIVEGVRPMAAAKQRMVDRCRTEFFVLVAEDMTLYPHAVDALLAAIRDTPPTVAMVAAPLWDVDTEQPIYGLKIWRHAAVQRVPFVSHPDGDRHDRERLRAAGLEVVKLPRTREGCLGDHGPSATLEEAFTRWQRLWQRHRRTGAQAWIEPWIGRLAERYRSTGEIRDLYALAGALVGAIGEPWPDDLDPLDAGQPNRELVRLLERLPG